MAAYVIVNMTVHDPARYEEYKRRAAATVTAHGGRYIVRGGTVETLEGEWAPRRIVVLEFPSIARAREWWVSADYAEAKTVRKGVADGEIIVVEGL